MRYSYIILALFFVLTACAGDPPAREPVPDRFFTPYQLDTGDRVRINVFGQENLTNTYAVDGTGLISMPLIGNVKARGLTTSELSSQVASALRNGYIRDPNVSSEVENYRPFFIMGEVTSAGQYAFVNGMTAQKAIAIAGGFTPRATKESVEIVRIRQGETLRAIVPVATPVHPGDTIVVRERWF